MNALPQPLKEEVVEFLIDLQKGLIDNDLWDFDVETCDWSAYQASFLDPTHLRTTLSVWLNHLKMNENGELGNALNARHRAAQYFRQYFDRHYTADPPFASWEIEEPY